MLFFCPFLWSSYPNSRFAIAFWPLTYRLYGMFLFLFCIYANALKKGIYLDYVIKPIVENMYIGHPQTLYHNISTSFSAATGSSRVVAFTSSLRTSDVIWGWLVTLITSRRASLCSGVMSEAYLCTKTRRLWCQSTGSSPLSPFLALYVFDSLMKWKTSESTTLYGNAYFLSTRTRINNELGPRASLLRLNQIITSRIYQNNPCQLSAWALQKNES